MEHQVTPEVLAAALRCSAAEDVHETHCETCPYYVVEDLSGEEAAFFGEKWATCDVDRMALDAAAMIEELDALCTALKSGDTSGYLEEYRRRCVTIGREVQLLWQDTKEKVTALDVDEEFGLIVRRENGTVETVLTGEVSVRDLYGYVE